MKNIKTLKLDKYENTQHYENIIFDIYLDKVLNHYCYCFEADIVDQYPLEDLLDLYSVSCGEYCGLPVVINGQTKNVVEILTESDSKEDFIRILSFSTIIGKEIINVQYGEYDRLVAKYADSNIMVNGNSIDVPIVAYRGIEGAIDIFEAQYPEMLYVKYFTNGQKIEVEIENFNSNNIKYIILKDRLGKIIYDDGDDMKEIIFDLNGFVEIKNV